MGRYLDLARNLIFKTAEDKEDREDKKYKEYKEYKATELGINAATLKAMANRSLIKATDHKTYYFDKETIDYVIFLAAWEPKIAASDFVTIELRDGSKFQYLTRCLCKYNKSTERFFDCLDNDITPNAAKTFKAIEVDGRWRFNFETGTVEDLEYINKCKEQLEEFKKIVKK